MYKCDLAPDKNYLNKINDLFIFCVNPRILSKLVDYNLNIDILEIRFLTVTNRILLT
jgi:hypothetical protein